MSQVFFGFRVILLRREVMRHKKMLASDYSITLYLYIYIYLFFFSFYKLTVNVSLYRTAFGAHR